MAKNVQTLLRESKKNKEKKIFLYNPDTEDFTTRFNGKPHTIRSLEIEPFSYDVANHIKKHLANHLYNKRGRKDGLNPTDSLEEIKKEIEVK